MKVKTRERYRIIGGDYSAQEPRLTAFMSQDPEMLKAYAEGKDLYAVIAQAMFNNNYEDNLEFYQEGVVVDQGGQKTVSGSGKTTEIECDGSFEAPDYYLIDTPAGKKALKALKPGDKFLASGEEKTVTKTEKKEQLNEISHKLQIFFE